MDVARIWNSFIAPEGCDVRMIWSLRGVTPAARDRQGPPFAHPFWPPDGTPPPRQAPRNVRSNPYSPYNKADVITKSARDPVGRSPELFANEARARISRARVQARM